MATDAAFLDEVAALLGTETPRSSKWGSNAAAEDSPMPLLLASPIQPLDETCLAQHDDKRGPSSSSSESDGETAKTCKDTLNRRQKYRLKAKCGREQLRRLERELTATLATLKQEREGRMTTARTDVALTKSFWRTVALQQREQREKAEAERERLMTTINSQQAYIDNLTQVSRHLSGNAGALADSGTSAFEDSKWLRLKSSDTAAFTTYVEELDQCYSMADRVFDECGFALRPEGSVYSLHRREGSRDIDFFQHLDKVYHPFPYEQSWRVMWELAGFPHRQECREEFKLIPDPDNTRAFKFRQTHTLSSGEVVSILKRAVVRRYLERDRVVFVWKVFLEGEGIFAGMDTVETTWMSVRPSSSELKTETIMEICGRQKPVPFVRNNSGNLPVDQFREVLAKEVELEVLATTTAFYMMMAGRVDILS